MSARRASWTIGLLAVCVGGLIAYVCAPVAASHDARDARDALRPAPATRVPPARGVADPDLPHVEPRSAPHGRAVPSAPEVPPLSVPSEVDAPIPFPPDLDPRHAPDAVEAWADALAEACPAARDAVITVDCTEFPCVVAVAWTGDATVRDVACRAPELADERMSEASGEVDGVTVSAVLLPVGPTSWPPSDLAARWAARWEARTRALRGEVMDDALAQEDAP